MLNDPCSFSPTTSRCSSFSSRSSGRASIVATAVAIVASDRADRLLQRSAARSRRSTGCRSRSSSSSAARRSLLQDEMFIKWKPTVLYGAVRRDPRRRQARVRPRPHRLPAEGRDASRAAIWSRVTWSWVGVLRRHGRRELVRRVPLLDRHLGQFQGLGRHRPVPRVRARAGPVARAPPERAEQAHDAPRP